jgi:hypothetical protein
MRYRKKPVEIDAALFDGRQVGAANALGKVVRGTRPRWFPAITRDVTGQGLAFMDNARAGEVYADGDKLLIVTPEGVMTASAGDWIIRGVAGELYPCKPEIFAATYDAVDDPSQDEHLERRVAGGSRG